MIGELYIANVPLLEKYLSRLSQLVELSRKGRAVLQRQPRDLQALAGYDKPERVAFIWLSYAQEAIRNSQFEPALAIVESTTNAAVLDVEIGRLLDKYHQQHCIPLRKRLDKESDGTLSNGMRVSKIMNLDIKLS
ncbi:MAG TPA: hypothetical protein VJJ82_02810 [Candidatus Nanoarchaeia archaeon]|nr:hypothetical protein [Candidatus Nanoarchaeia archaeon]